MNIRIGDITITSLETISCYDVVTGDFRFMLDELQTATISQSEDTQDITGKQGRRLNTLKRNKAVTISGTNGLVSAGLMELQTGGSFENKETLVRWTDYVTVKSDKASTEFKAVGTAGAEIECLRVKNADGTLSDKALVQDAAASSGKFAYDPETKELSFNAGEIADGTELFVVYDRKIKGDVLSNMSDVYSQKCLMYIDAFGEDTCGNVHRVQVRVPKADFSGNFEMAMGDSQTVHAFEANALAGACGTAGLYWDYTIFGANEEDVA